MRKLLLTLCVTAFGSGAMAWADCPAPADTSNELLNLIARAQGAENATQGQRISNQMWQVWLRAPDEAAQSGAGRRNAPT